MPKPVSATRIGALAALVLAAACTDRTPMDPAGTPPAGREVRTEIACTVSVADGAVRCADPAPAGGAPRDLILGGQGTYVRLASANAGRDGATGEFVVDVAVQNLLSLQMGTPDGTTATGVRVFFEQMPTATAGSGEVTVANADGTGTFTRVGQPYFAYPGILEPRGSSAPRTWRFGVPDGVTRFGFTVYVHTALPAEQGVLRWLQEEGAAWTPLMQVRALWGTSPNDVFAVGLSGRILHSDGARWVAMRSGTGAGLLGVWGTSRRDVYAVGDSGTVLRYDGNRWNRLAGPVANRFLRTIWGRGDTLWIAGYQRDANARTHGLLMRSVDGGATWSETLSTAASGNRQLWGITGTSGGALVVTGLQFGTADGHNDAVILRSTNGGESWTEQEVVSEPSARHLYRVWAQGEHVFAVGERSSETVAGFEGFTMRSADGGVTWTRESHAAPLSLYGVWGSAPDDVTAFGAGGGLHYDGTGWTAVNPGATTNAFHAVWGSSAGTVLAAGNNQLMARRTDGVWALTPFAGDFDHNYVAVWGTGTSDLYAVARVYGYDVNYWGTALLRRTAQGWTTVRPWESKLELMGIWGTGTGIVIVSGFRYNDNTGRYEGVILRNGGSGWTETVRVMGADTRFNAVYGDGAGNVWIAGNANTTPGSPLQGVVLTSADNGASWTDTRIPLPEAQPQLLDIWASGPGDVHAVGRAYNSTTASSAAFRARYDGTAWTWAVADSASGLYTVWGAGGTIFAAGYQGAFLAGDRKGLILSSTDGGRTFAQTVVAPTAGNFREFSAAWGASSQSMYLVGTGGGILHFDGMRWEETGAGTRTPLSAIWGLSATSVYAVGGGGAVLHGIR